MSEKLELYDILSSLILGILAIVWVPICFPVLLTVKGPKYPDAFLAIVLVAAGVFTGQLIQALASMLEPLLFWAMDGRPSDQALAGKLSDRYFAKSEAERIKAKILTAMGGSEQTKGAIFRFAMQRSDAAGIGRAARFNSLYAYHRGLLVLVVLATITLFLSMKWGAAASWPLSLRWVSGVIALLLLLLFWNRTKQRGIYYAREVLLTAERVIDEKIITTSKPPEALTKG